MQNVESDDSIEMDYEVNFYRWGNDEKKNQQYKNL